MQERLEERTRERLEKQAVAPRDPAAAQQFESLRLGRTELERQLELTTHERRREMISRAIADLDRQMNALRDRLA